MSQTLRGRSVRPGQLRAERVPLDRGGYDRGGRYWGVGGPLYRVTDDEGYLDEYVRAPDAPTTKSRAVQQAGGTLL